MSLVPHQRQNPGLVCRASVPRKLNLLNDLPISLATGRARMSRKWRISLLNGWRKRDKRRASVSARIGHSCYNSRIDVMKLFYVCRIKHETQLIKLRLQVVFFSLLWIYQKFPDNLAKSIAHFMALFIRHTYFYAGQARSKNDDVTHSLISIVYFTPLSDVLSYYNNI